MTQVEILKQIEKIENEINTINSKSKLTIRDKKMLSQLQTQMNDLKQQYNDNVSGANLAYGEDDQETAMFKITGPQIFQLYPDQITSFNEIITCTINSFVYPDFRETMSNFNNTIDQLEEGMNLITSNRDCVKRAGELAVSRLDKTTNLFSNVYLYCVEVILQPINDELFATFHHTLTYPKFLKIFEDEYLRKDYRGMVYQQYDSCLKLVIESYAQHCGSSNQSQMDVEQIQKFLSLVQNCLNEQNK